MSTKLVGMHPRGSVGGLSFESFTPVMFDVCELLYNSHGSPSGPGPGHYIFFWSQCLYSHTESVVL